MGARRNVVRNSIAAYAQRAAVVLDLVRGLAGSRPSFHSASGLIVNRKRALAVALLFSLFAPAVPSSFADIYQWEWVDPADPSLGKRQSETLCPGGAGAKPGPNASLSSRDLTQAFLIGANLECANVTFANLTDADLSQANLVCAQFHQATFTGAELAGATIAAAELWEATSHGFTKEQLYSTASYRAKNLRSIEWDYDDLSGWSFAGQDLRGASFYCATLARADLTDAMVTGALFEYTTARGFSNEQLYSTGSYTAKDLRSIRLGNNELSGWSFAGQNLTGASLRSAALPGADLTSAVLTNADLGDTTARGFSKEQLYSTASYQTRDLHGIRLDYNDLSGWNFVGQNLTGASLFSTSLACADLTDAKVTGAILRCTTPYGLTAQQLYSTASYKARDLHGIQLDYNDLSGWNLAGQNVAGTNFTGTVLRGASLEDTTSRGFTEAQLYSTASYQAKDLQEVRLGNNRLCLWKFMGQNLTNASFSRANLALAKFSSANLSNADLSEADLAEAGFSSADLTSADLSRSNLAEANFHGAIFTDAVLTDAVVTGADFGDTTSRGFTQQQLYSTASYRAKDLQGIVLDSNDLSGWSFAGQNLKRARFHSATLTGVDLHQSDLAAASFQSANLTGVDLTDTAVAGARFTDTTSRGFTKELLYSTPSYKAKDLQAIGLSDNDLTDWSFAGQNLRWARFRSSTLTRMDITDAVVAGADFGDTTSRGFTEAQLYSTASYRNQDLSGVDLGGNDMPGWNFAGQNLMGASLSSGTLTGADLRQANLAKAYFYGAKLTGADLRGADLRGARGAEITDAFTVNTIRPDGTIWRLSLGEGDRLVVRNNGGQINVQTSMSMAEGAALELRFSDVPWSSNISFQSGIGVSLGGELELSLEGDARLYNLIGKTMGLFTWKGAAVSGTFGRITVEPGTEWDTSGLYTWGQVGLLWAVRDSTHALSWDVQGDGVWSSTAQWVGAKPGQSPDGRSRVSVSANTITVSSEGEAHSLSVAEDGRVLVKPGKSLWVYSETAVVGGSLELGGTLKTLAATVKEGAIKAEATGKMEIRRDLVLENTECWCELSQTRNGHLVAKGHAVIGPGNSLKLQAVSILTPQGTWGNVSKAIIVGSSVSGAFSVVPAEGVYLGRGVLYENVVYGLTAVTANLFQAGPGDTWNDASNVAGVDRMVDVTDIQQILREAKFNSGEPAVWTDGDFNNDNRVTAADIQLVLAANLFKADLYGAGEVAATGTAPNVALRLTPEGLVIDTQGAVVNGYVLSSGAGLLTGEAAENLGVFQVDSDREISGQMFFALSGEHLLGQVAGAGLTAEQLSGDLRLSYTVAGKGGIYEATLVVPEPGMVGLLWSGFVVLGAVFVTRWNRRSSFTAERD